MAKIQPSRSAVGLGVTEGADVGALFSLYVAAFVLYWSLTKRGHGPAGIISAGLRVAGVALFAVFIAAHSLTILHSLEIKRLREPEAGHRNQTPAMGLGDAVEPA